MMNKRYFNGMKAVILSGLIGLASLAHAEVKYYEQILEATGGTSVSVDGQWLAVGAYNSSITMSCYVSIYRLDYATMTWSLHTRLDKASGNCNGNKGFGAALSLSKGELVVGLKDYNNQNVGAFSAYKYNSATNIWDVLIENVVPTNPDGTTDGQTDSGFGTAVNIQEGILMVGAPGYDRDATSLDNGKVYLYERPSSFGTTLVPKVTIVGSQTLAKFGSAVSGSYQNILVGAPFYDQGNYNDNGAGFMYKYNPLVPSLAQIGGMYGTANSENLGLRLEHKGNDAVISGNLRSYGYVFDGSVWQRDLTLQSTLGGDVDINNNVSALAIKGNSVYLYPSLLSSFNSYFLRIIPTPTTPALGVDFAKDISLSQNNLLASAPTNTRARSYRMPCGYGSTLVENEWAMVNIPCKISGQTVSSIFGDDGLGTYDTNWVVYAQNTSNYSGKSNDAVKLTGSSPIVQGKSYWIIADANRTWKVDTTASITRTDLNTTSVPNPTVVGGTYAIPLPIADQNLSGNAYAKVMVGNPLPRSFEWTNVQYSSVTNGTISLDVAKTNTYMESTAYIYDGSITSGQPYAAVTTTPGVGSKTIPVNKGFWIKMLKNAKLGDKLLIPYEK